MIFSCWYYLLLLKWQKLYGSYPRFQEDSNELKYILFGYCMNKLWIFEVLIITSPKTWVGNTKTMIKHDLQQLYISCLLQCIFSTTGLFCAYSRKWRSPKLDEASTWAWNGERGAGKRKWGVGIDVRNPKIDKFHQK
jgi:hypothetical protein